LRSTLRIILPRPWPGSPRPITLDRAPDADGARDRPRHRQHHLHLDPRRKLPAGAAPRRSAGPDARHGDPRCSACCSPAHSASMRFTRTAVRLPRPPPSFRALIWRPSPRLVRPCFACHGRAPGTISREARGRRRQSKVKAGWRRSGASVVQIGLLDIVFRSTPDHRRGHGAAGRRDDRGIVASRPCSCACSWTPAR